MSKNPPLNSPDPAPRIFFACPPRYAKARVQRVRGRTLNACSSDLERLQLGP